MDTKQHCLHVLVRGEGNSHRRCYLNQVGYNSFIQPLQPFHSQDGGQGVCSGRVVECLALLTLHLHASANHIQWIANCGRQREEGVCVSEWDGEGEVENEGEGEGEQELVRKREWARAQLIFCIEQIPTKLSRMISFTVSHF